METLNPYDEKVTPVIEAQGSQKDEKCDDI